MKYAAVGLMCLVTGVTLGAGAPKSAQKWKYSTFVIPFNDCKTREGWSSEDYPAMKIWLDRLESSEVVTAELSPGGCGWQFLVREPVK